MAIDTIKFKRGVKSKLNNLSYGEPAYISDENELYIGTENGVEKITRNKEVAELSSQLEHIVKKEVNILDYGADLTGTVDSSDAIQRAINEGVRVMSPPGKVLIKKPIVVHNKNGFHFECSSTQGVEFITDVDLTLDKKALPLTLEGYDNVNAFFVLTFYDGENNRVNYPARNMTFKNISFKSSSPNNSAFHAYGLAHCNFRDIVGENLNSLFRFENINKDTSRFYYLDFNNCRSIRNKYHIFLDEMQDGQSVYGSTWQIQNNNLTRCENGFLLYGLVYVDIIGSGIDQQKQGSYGFVIKNSHALNISSCALEVRYQGNGGAEDLNAGCGFINIYNSSVQFDSCYFAGGDKNGKGTGNVSDYGIPTFSIIDMNSSVIFNNMWIDCAKSTNLTNRYPITLKNGSYLLFNKIKNTTFQDFEVHDNCFVNIQKDNGNVEIKKGDTHAGAKIVGYDNLLDSYDDTTLVGSAISNNLTLNSLTSTRVYKSNPSSFENGTTITDVKVQMNYPINDRWGIIKVFRVGTYIEQIYTNNSNRYFIRISTDGGTSWKEWQELVAYHGGTTRPTSAYLYPGKMFYDENIKKPIWYNGTNWTDAQGNNV